MIVSPTGWSTCTIVVLNNALLDYSLHLISWPLTDVGQTLVDFHLPAVRFTWEQTVGNPLLAAEFGHSTTEDDGLALKTMGIL